MHVLVRPPSESTSSRVHVQSLHTPSLRDERNETGCNASHCRAAHLVERVRHAGLQATCSARSPCWLHIRRTRSTRAAARAASCTHHRAQSARHRRHTQCRYSVIKRAFVHRARPHVRLGLRQLLELSTHRRHRLIRRADGIRAVRYTRSSSSSLQQYAVRAAKLVATRSVTSALQCDLVHQRLGQVFWVQCMDNSSSRAGVSAVCAMPL
jgi:hypothetical protein